MNKMVKRIGSSRRKSRGKYKKTLREKGKTPITKYLKTFKVGEKVLLSIEPAVQKGVFSHKFHGKTGIISKKTGKSYEIQITETI